MREQKQSRSWEKGHKAIYRKRSASSVYFGIVLWMMVAFSVVDMVLVWWWMTREVDLVVKPGMKVVVEIEAVSLHKWTNLDKKVQSVHLKYYTKPLEIFFPGLF